MKVIEKFGFSPDFVNPTKTQQRSIALYKQSLELDNIAGKMQLSQQDLPIRHRIEIFLSMYEKHMRHLF